MIANKTLSISVLFTPAIIGGMAGMAVLVGCSGSYPALYLSSFDPAEVIKGQSDMRGGNGMSAQNPCRFSVCHFCSHDHGHFYNRFPA